MSNVSYPNKKQAGIEQVTAWLEEYGDELFGYLSARIVDPNTAEDVLQEALLAAVESWPSFRGESSPRTWLTAILRRKLLDHFRSQGQARKFANPEAETYFSESGHWRRTLGRWPAKPSQELERREFWEAFDECCSKLSPKVADAFVMREMDGLEPEEICDLLQITRTNFFARLHRARLALRACLEKNWFKTQ